MGATAALGFSSASLNYGAASAQASAEKMQGQFQKDSFEENARLARMQADDVERIGKKEANRQRKRTKQAIGSQKAALAAQGLDISEGSAVEILEDTAEIGAEDAETIRNNAFKEAFGIRTQALDMESRGRMSEIGANFNSRMTLITGGMRALNSGLSAYQGSQ